MKVRSFGAMAGLSKRLEEHSQLRWRTALPSREFVRRHEERRQVGLALEGRKQSGRRDGGPRGWRQSSEEQGIVQRSHPKGPDRIGIGISRNEFPAVAALHESQVGPFSPTVDGRVDPQEVFGREGENRSDRFVLFRRESFGEAEKDS